MRAQTSDLLVSLGGREDGPSVLLIHPAGGGVLPYLPLVHGLAPMAQVSALRAFGLMAGEVPDPTIDRAVDRYEPVVAVVEPDVVIGWSMGGLLSWELVARLEGRGTPPRALVIIDSDPTQSPGLSTRDAHGLADVVLSNGLPGASTGSTEERQTAVAHVRANAEHAVTTTHAVPTLVMICDDGPMKGRERDWASLAPAVQVEHIPGGHFEVFSPHVLPSLMRSIHAFLQARAGVVIA